MADTIRTLDELLDASTGLLKDNTAGDISAQDLRDAVVSLFSYQGAGDNLIINGGFRYAQRVDPTAATAMTDDAYNHFDRWYSLIQGANATITRVAGTDNTQYNAKLVAGGTTNRFGIAQIAEAGASIPLRGREIRAQCRVRPTLNAGAGSMDVRIAILEWTGTADSVTSEVVNDWTSSTYTTGNFFTSTTLTVVGVATVAASHNTWTDLSVSGTVSSSCNNLIVMIWHEDAPAHAADYLEIAKARLHEGSEARAWLPRLSAAELVLCQRYYCKTFDADQAPIQALGISSGGLINARSSGTVAAMMWYYPAKMRTAPSVTTYNPTQANANWRTAGDTTDITVAVGMIGDTAAALSGSSAADTTTYRIHASAEAEL